MPQAFEMCRAAGGRVRTVTGNRYGCGKNQYRRICFLKGKSYLGEIKTRKTTQSATKRR